MSDKTEIKKAEQKKRNKRSIAIALMLVAFAVLFYAITIIRLGGNVFNRPL
jgi:hypothetical protein